PVLGLECPPRFSAKVFALNLPDRWVRREAPPKRKLRFDALLSPFSIAKKVSNAMPELLGPLPQDVMVAPARNDLFGQLAYLAGDLCRDVPLGCIDRYGRKVGFQIILARRCDHHRQNSPLGVLPLALGHPKLSQRVAALANRSRAYQEDEQVAAF